jgi:hypothetical protein
MSQTCWVAPSVTHGAVEAVSPAYSGMPDSLVCQGEGSRSVVEGVWHSELLGVPESRIYL